MFAKRIFQKSAAQQSQAAPTSQGHLTATDLDPRIILHYGIPSTASLIAFDSVQSLLAIGTLDGRIKVIGGDNIEAIFVSPKQSPFKNLDFIQNQGLLVSISNENQIQVWDLECRQAVSNIQWESNITAFSIPHGSSYMYVGDEYGLVSVLKYVAEEKTLMQLPYYVPADALAEAAGVSSPIQYPVVGILSQPCSQGNRLLIAFSNGLLFLWDVSEDRVVLVRGNNDLVLEGPSVSDSAGASQDELSDLDLEEKEISSLCWASSDGSVLAVGYIDGDILFWNFSDWQGGKPPNHVKLQLSSAKRRLPVIVLNWCQDISRKDSGGRLFIYGGDVSGSEEVLTVSTMLNLDWSSGIGSLKCVERVDLTLNGSFADMVLSPISSSMQGGVFLFLLTSPGQLHVYDGATLKTLMSQSEKGASVTPLSYPMVVTTMEPCISVAMLSLLHENEETARALSAKVIAAKVHAPQGPETANTAWPLTGGVPSQPEDLKIERLYIAGYQDGSVRIWDATYPALSLIYALGPEVKGIDVAGPTAPISALDFCSLTLNLATGNESGMVFLHRLIGHKGQTSTKIITGNDIQVRDLHHNGGPQCVAVFSLISSAVCSLKFAASGKRLAVGFICSRVAMLDISTSSVLFLTDCISDPSPISILPVKPLLDANDSINDQDISETKNVVVHENLVVYAAKNSNVFLLDGNFGKILATCSEHQKASTAISIHIIENCGLNYEVQDEKPIQNLSKGETDTESDPANHSKSIPPEDVHHTVAESISINQRLLNPCILLCSEDALRLYSLKSLYQGNIECIQEVNLQKPCCWMATLKKDEEEWGLVLLYRTGVIEIRSFPTLDVVGESSLMSILRWNFKTNMEKSVCCSDRGHLVLVNGCEFAILSLLANENDFRIPQSLPSLHDEVLAAAANAALSQSPTHKKKQDIIPGILGGIIKGFKQSNQQKSDNDFSHLDRIFSNPPYMKPSAADRNEDKIRDEDKIIELNIDDIEIDEPVIVHASPGKNKKEKKDKETERERLFEGASSDGQPRPRTIDEIKAKYRKPGDTAAIASQARDKLLERQEKLERISERTAELQNGAENFASMANELVKQMEKKKWWNI